MEQERALGYYQGMRYVLALMESGLTFKDIKIDVQDKMETMRKEYAKTEEVKT